MSVHFLQGDLSRALDNGELLLHYQPLVSTETGQLCGCEALLRWFHPERDAIGPDVFIPIAEATGLIVPIGNWVLRQACAEAARWPEHLTIAVNISAAQFQSGNLVSAVTDALQKSGLAAERLEIEITESVLLDEDTESVRILHELHAMGVRIALDDFGTGYSSLSYLRLFPFDKIKIDRSFVATLSHRNPNSRTLIRALSRMASGLGMAATAEGIETEGQFDIVRSEGCTEAQGFLFGKAQPAEEIRKHFQNAGADARPLSHSWSKMPGKRTLDDPRDAEEQRLAALREYDVLDTPPEESFDRITRLARRLLQAPIAAISLVDRDRQWFKSRVGLEATETPRNISFCTHTVRKNEPLIVGDALDDPRFCASPLVTGAPHIRAYVGVPLRTPDGHNIGALCINDVQPRQVTREEVDVLQDLARMVVDELELRKLATVDGLTGAATSRAFLADANKEIERTRRHSRDLACVMFDLDHFKAINDTYGHSAGDQVLSEVIAACRSQIRSSDLLGRMGGEEFAILLPETGVAEATQIAEWVRETIATLCVTHLSNVLQVTASFGVTGLTPRDKGMKDMLGRADAALYTAKKAGRNQVSSLATASAATARKIARA